MLNTYFAAETIVSGKVSVYYNTKMEDADASKLVQCVIADTRLSKSRANGQFYNRTYHIDIFITFKSVDDAQTDDNIKDIHAALLKGIINYNANVATHTVMKLFSFVRQAKFFAGNTWVLTLELENKFEEAIA